MADDRDSSGWTDSPVTKDRLSFGGHDASSLLTGVVVGAALGALLLHLFQKKRSTEEPPIRVKGGSTKFEVMSSVIYWVEDGSKRQWRLSGDREKRTDNYKVCIDVVENGVPKRREVFGDVVRVYYQDDNHWVQLKAHSKKTKLHSHDYVEQDKNYLQLLTHPRNILKIQVGNKVPYFADDATFTEMVVYDIV